MEVNLLDLAASCISSAIVAADQITGLARKKNARLKDDGSIVTDADMAAQKIIFGGIRKVSKDVRIIGEENEEEMMRSSSITGYEHDLHEMFQLAQKEILVRYNATNNDNNDNNNSNTCINELPLAQQQQQQQPIEDASTTVSPKIESSCTNNGTSMEKMKVYEIDANRVSVFVDPLDATSAYAKGDYDPVSILIAIILDNKTPCFGVICKPFGYPKQRSILKKACVAVYGGILLGEAYIAGGGTVRNYKQEMDSLPRAVISSTRSEGVVQNFVTHMAEKDLIHHEPLLVSGAGEKSLRIILRSENEGLWFFPKSGTSLWDVAACDALLRVTGGKLTDKYGNDMDYSKSRTKAENIDGVVACFDETLHQKCIKIFGS